MTFFSKRSNVARNRFRRFQKMSKVILPSFAGVLLFHITALGQNAAFEVDRWERSKDAIVISDMSVVTPGSALSSDVRRVRKWKVLEYETKAGLKGKCIASLPDTGAPEVTLPLNVKGWYAIYVGLGGMGRFAFGQES